MSIKCGFCGNQFEPKNNKQKYCSPLCMQYACNQRYKEKNPSKVREIKNNWMNDHRHEGARQDKNLARYQIEIALKKGSLIKPETCEKCGGQKKTEAHHHNGYENPLSVMWLCKECHLRVHGKIAK